jgi:hypothetical protein
MSVFELAKLIPEPLTFVDTDGTRYDARPVSALGAIDYARYERMQREATARLARWPRVMRRSIRKAHRASWSR